jgi:PHD/YefM family antitoxin component YafN of YafNO toxin-antitoxin module
MNTLIIDRQQRESKLLQVVRNVEQIAASQARHEKEVNKFLDRINTVKEHLLLVAQNVSALLPGLSDLSWFSNMEEDELATVIALIKAVEKLAASIVRSYAATNKVFRPMGIAKDELRAYKECADALKEVTTDLLARFVSLPQDEEFQRLMQELSKL